MGFLRNGTVGHSARLETSYNGIYAFHFFQRHALLRIIKVHGAADITGFFFINKVCIFFK